MGNAIDEKTWSCKSSSYYTQVQSNQNFDEDENRKNLNCSLFLILENTMFRTILSYQKTLAG